MQVSPLQQIKERFGDPDISDKREAREKAKEALVKEIRGLMKKGDLLEDDFSEKGPERVSNQKLLKLYDLALKVKDDFGSRSALVDKIIEIEKREKDSKYRDHFEKYNLPALYSYYTATRKRAR